MDEHHLLAAARYIEMNPVAVNLVEHPEEYRWSSARAHVEGKDDELVNIVPLLEIIPAWKTRWPHIEVSETWAPKEKRRQSTILFPEFAKFPRKKGVSEDMTTLLGIR